METSPLEWVFIGLVVVVPVLGITARLALKPIVDAILTLQEGFSRITAAEPLETRIRHMASEIAELRDELRRVSERSAFHESLLANRSDSEKKAIDSSTQSERQRG